MGAPRETEVKLRVADVAAARQALRALGARLARPRHFEDNVLFDDATGSLRARGSVLRLRRAGASCLLTFKGPREVTGGVKSREERETEVADADALDGILLRLGFRPVFRYQKYRESWTHLGQAVEVDETPIGAFLEIEGDREGIVAVAGQLGYTAQDYVSDSYVGLFFAGGGVGDMVFDSACPEPPQTS
jgi:adenylate cyclase class 2